MILIIKNEFWRHKTGFAIVSGSNTRKINSPMRHQNESFVAQKWNLVRNKGRRTLRKAPVGGGRPQGAPRAPLLPRTAGFYVRSGPASETILLFGASRIHSRLKIVAIAWRTKLIWVSAANEVRCEGVLPFLNNWFSAGQLIFMCRAGFLAKIPLWPCRRFVTRI